MGRGERVDVLQGTQWSGALDKGSNSMYDRSVHVLTVRMYGRCAYSLSLRAMTVGALRVSQYV